MSNLILASQLLDKLDLEGAIAAVGKDYVLNPHDPASYLNLGMIFVASRMPSQAIRVLNAGLKLQPSNASLLAYRGEAYSLLRKFNQAEKDYAASLSLESLNLAALFGLGKLRIDQEAYGEAVQFFTQILEMHGGIPQVYAERAYALTMQGNLEAAINDCTSALHIQPNFVVALTSRASLYELTGQMENAEQDVEFLRSLEHGAELVEHITRKTREE